MKQQINNTKKTIASKITKIVKMGEQYIFTIPKPLIDSGVLNLEKEYNFKIEEVDSNA